MLDSDTAHDGLKVSDGGASKQSFILVTEVSS